MLLRVVLVVAVIVVVEVLEVEVGAAGSAGTGATGVGAAGGVGAGGSADAGTSEGAGAGAPGAGGATGAGAPAGSPRTVPAGSGGAPRPRPVSTACPVAVPVTACLSPTGGLAERRAPASRPTSPARPACTSRRTSRPRPPAVPGTHQMALRPSTAPLRVPLPSPPASSLPASADPEFDSLRAASPTVARFLATVVTDPSLASTAASALVAELVDFAARCRLDYAASLVAESAFVCPPSVGDPDAPDIPTPRSYAEAIEGPYSSQWQAAMDAEMASCKSTGTYVDDVPPPGANIISGMWIFRVKRPAGSPPVFKARYVARGFSQRQGVDYFQTFSPTPKMTTLRVLLHVAAQRDYELHSLDFSKAFLQGSLHEEIWLRRPPGFTGSFPPGTQWSLRRPVYGLRQAPWEWHDTLRTTLAALGSAPSTADPSLFLRTDTSLLPFYVLVYVEDLIFATADTGGLAHVKSELQKRHTCTNLGELRSYLGLQITRDRAQRTINLTQSHMVQQVLQRFDFTYSSPQATPLSTHHSLSALPLDESVEPSGPYPELVGCLIEEGVALLVQYVSWGMRHPPLTGTSPRFLTIDLLEQQLLAAETSVVAVGAALGTPRTPVFEGCSPSLLAPSYVSAAAVDVLGAKDVGDASVSGRRHSSKGKGGRVVGILTWYRSEGLGYESQCVHLGHPSAGGCQRSTGDPRLILGKGYRLVVLGGYGRTNPLLNMPLYPNGLVVGILTGGGSRGGGGGSTGGGGGTGGGSGSGSGGGSGGFGSGGSGSGGGGGSGGSGSGGSRAGATQRGGSGGGERQQQQRRSKTPSPQQHRCFSCLDNAWHAESGDEAERPRWAELLRSGVAIFDLDYDAILAAMYAFSVSAEGDCYLCAPPDPGIEAAALGASLSALPGTALAEALHTFTLDSGASRCTTLTPLSAPVPASLPRLHGMHSCLLVSALPRSLPPLPPSPAPPCLPCVERWQRAAPHSSSFPPTTAPLQTLHMDVWGPARVSGQGRKRYFLLVVDDYTSYTTVFLLRNKGQVVDVLITWIRAVRLQLRERMSRLTSRFPFTVTSPTALPLPHPRRSSLLQVPLRSLSAQVLLEGAEPGGAEPGGGELEGVERGGAESEGAKSGGAEPRGAASSGGFAGAGVSAAGVTGAGGVGVPAGAGGTGGAAAAGTGAAGTGSVGGAGAGGAGTGDPAEPGGAGAGGAGAGRAGAGDTGVVGDGAGGTGVGGVGAGGAGAGDTGTFDPGAGGAGAGGAVSGSTGAGATPASPLPAPSSYTQQTGGLTERHEHASRPFLPVCDIRTGRRVPYPRPPESSLPTVPDPRSHLARAASPTVSPLLATVVTDPSFESSATSVLVAELVDFAAACRLDYAIALVVESGSANPPSVRRECALGTDVLEDRQEDLECLAAAVPHFASLLLAPEGDPDARDILTPHSYVEAITGTYVDKAPPLGANIVDGMWIFRVKRPPGSPLAFKARYIAQGLSQRQGVDYFQTFFPTSKMTTLRVLLHVAAQRDYELHTLEFSTAFLQGSLHEEIWLRRPPGFTGLFPASLGFTPSTANLLLFLRTDMTLPLFYILVYIDELIFATADTEALTLVKLELQKRHTCTNLGELRSYLGLQITQDRAWCTITLTQSHMVHYVLQRFGFQFSSPQPTPVSTSHSLSAPPSDESVEPSGPYAELVGCLITSGMGLVLGGQGPVVLTGHADASWVDDLATQWSSQGYTFSLGSALFPGGLPARLRFSVPVVRLRSIRGPWLHRSYTGSPTC
ncbi:unnamed protein product [Closterium sp. NIES-54]